MAAVTICSDFGAPKNKVWHCFHCFPNLFPMKWWDKMPWSSFSECWAPLPKIFIKVLCIKAKTRNRLLLLLSHSAMSNTCELMDCSPPGFSVHWILQAKILEWVAIPFSRGSSWPRDRTQVSCTASGFFTVCATIGFSTLPSRSHLITNSHGADGHFKMIWGSN